MKTTSQLPDAANSQPDGHNETTQPGKDLQSELSGKKNASYPAKNAASLQTNDMNLIKNYSQFFIELS